MLLSPLPAEVQEGGGVPAGRGSRLDGGGVVGVLARRVLRPVIRGAPSTVKNFSTSFGCSMEGAPPKKETVPTVLGVALF